MAELLDCSNINLKQGSKGSNVTLLQKHLTTFGYYNGLVNGEFGPLTEAAVKKFQKATGHTPDGWFGPKTCRSLNEKLQLSSSQNLTLDCPKINLKRGSKGNNVTILQTMLHQLGYYNGLINGEFGSITEAAVKAFQKDTKHSVDGVFGPKTCPDLNSAFKKKVATDALKNNNTSSNASTDKYKADTSKNVFNVNEANLTIDGLHFIASAVTYTNQFHGGNWKTVELMNGKNYIYKGRPTPLEYSIDCYMTTAQYSKLKQEFDKMGERVCNVVSNLITSGYYTITVSIAREKVSGMKITFKLTEYMV